MGHYPCPGCPPCGAGETCVLFSDDFERADDTDIGSEWTEVAGNWVILSGALRIVSALALPTIAIVNAAPASQVYLAETVFSATTDDLPRLLVGYVDSSNHFFVEIKVHASTGHIRLVEVSGGSETELAILDGLNTTGFAAIKACHDGTHLVGFSDDETDRFVMAEVAAFGATDKVGVGQGGVGTVDFFSITVSRVEEVCEDCPKGQCGEYDEELPPVFHRVFDAEGAPVTVSIDLTGVVAKVVDGCSWCGTGAPSDGLFALGQVATSDVYDRYTSANEFCSYLYYEFVTNPGSDCGEGGEFDFLTFCLVEMLVQIFWDVPGVSIKVSLLIWYHTVSEEGDACDDDPPHFDFSGIAYFESASIPWSDETNKFDAALVNLVIPFDGGIGDAWCDWAGGTCTFNVLS